VRLTSIVLMGIRRIPEDVTNVRRVPDEESSLKLDHRALVVNLKRFVVGGTWRLDNPTNARRAAITESKDRLCIMQN